MSYVIGFLPWIAYSVVPDRHWLIAALLGLALAAVLSARRLFSGRPLSASLLELTGLVFFAAMTVVAAVAPHSPVHDWSSPISSTALAVMAWVSLAVGQPFTLGIAKDMVPEEFWESPRFLHVNVVITRFWAVSFTVSAALLAIVHAASMGETASIVVQVAGIAVPIVFTNRYSKQAEAQAKAAMAEV
jgi:hypothetical protein